MAKLKEVNNEIKVLYRKLMRDKFNRGDMGTQTTWQAPIVEAAAKDVIMVDKGIQTVPISIHSPIQSPRIRTLQTFDEEDDYTQEVNDENIVNYIPKSQKVNEKAHQSSIFHQRTPRKKVTINYKGKIIFKTYSVVHSLTHLIIERTLEEV